MNTLPPITSELDLADVPKYLTARRDQELVAAVRSAHAELRTTFMQITAEDIFRAVLRQPDATAWLDSLAGEARTLRASLASERKRAEDLLLADERQRHRFDSTAMRLMTDALESERFSRRAHADEAQRLERMRDEMTKQGFAPDKVDSLLESGVDHEAEADAAKDRARRLGAFINDPLRDVDALPPALAAEMHEHHAVMYPVEPESVAMG